MFFCVPGARVDGHDFAKMAVENGAVAIVCERPLDLPQEITQVIVPDVRFAMGRMAHAFVEYPARSMKMIGVTGTNGKTSTTHMIKAMLEAEGLKVGLVGTIVNMIGDLKLYTDHTTPEAVDLALLLGRMRDVGVQAVVMEVSSHSLALQRVAGITFDVAAFTNLTQDHLDFHGDLEHYKQAKRKLFFVARSAVINADDAASKEMVEGFGGPISSFGIENPADVMAKDIRYSLRGSSFRLAMDGLDGTIYLRIPGKFSIKNALTAAAVCRALKISRQSIQLGLESLAGVPGRIEVLDTHGLEFTVVLDYAHSPDGLENVLSSIREYAPKRILTVFGCGGDRDHGKRPIMGAMAGKYSDFCVITSDNPRTEDPMAIIADIQPGTKQTGCDYAIIEPRREAIEYAMRAARPGDVVLLAGKGHENYQEIHGVRHHFDEKEIVEEIASRMRDERAKA